MADTGSYDKRASHRDVESEMRRLAGQASGGWGKEARTLDWFGVRDGMSVLELGSGPGFITKQMLDLLPSSSVTSVEVDPEMVAKASAHLGDEPRARLVEASAMATGLPDGQFDVAYARLLFQHLADPLGAAREALRVLRPGGRLIVYDIDDGILGLFDPPIDGLDEVVAAFGRAQASRGGDRHIGRRLWRTLAAAGFRDITLEALVSTSDESGVEPFLANIDPDRLVGLVRSGGLAEEALERLRASREAFAQAPGAVTMWLSLMACGVKPDE